MPQATSKSSAVSKRQNITCGPSSTLNLPHVHTTLRCHSLLIKELRESPNTLGGQLAMSLSLVCVHLPPIAIVSARDSPSAFQSLRVWYLHTANKPSPSD